VQTLLNLKQSSVFEFEKIIFLHANLLFKYNAGTKELYPTFPKNNSQSGRSAL
jgi:hypothetical protein